MIMDEQAEQVVKTADERIADLEQKVAQLTDALHHTASAVQGQVHGWWQKFEQLLFGKSE